LARRHAVLIIALANAREIHLTLPHDGALRVDLSRSARELELVSPMRYNKGESIITDTAPHKRNGAPASGREWPRMAFTLRAPRLRCLMWSEVCVGSMHENPRRQVGKCDVGPDQPASRGAMIMMARS
jgi:hypothetical protein